MKKKSWKMHFYEGKPCTWDGDAYDEESEEYVFKARLKPYTTERGCSSAVLIMIPENAEFDELDRPIIKYPVFMSDLVDFVKYAKDGIVSGTFEWVKKGANYGIKLIKSE